MRIKVCLCKESSDTLKALALMKNGKVNLILNLAEGTLVSVFVSQSYSWIMKRFTSSSLQINGGMAESLRLNDKGFEFKYLEILDNYNPEYISLT